LSGKDRETWKEIEAAIGKETNILGGEIEDIHKEAAARIKLLRDPLVINERSASRGPFRQSHFADMPDSPEYLQTLYKFSEGIKASGVSREICPHPDRVMVRYYGPDDAKQAEKFLKEAGFDFLVESDG